MPARGGVLRSGAPKRPAALELLHSCRFCCGRAPDRVFLTGSTAMCRIRLAIFAILLGFCTAADIANADEAEAWTALHAGRHVALMRRTDAPGGAGDPPGFRVDDCATQRNLGAKGRADAASIGARLRSEGIAVERILSSPWCRCMDTATLLELGPVEAEPTFGNVVVLNDQRASLTAGARARSSTNGPGAES